MAMKWVRDKKKHPTIDGSRAMMEDDGAGGGQ
jgi:hypothetical protein